MQMTKILIAAPLASLALTFAAADVQAKPNTFPGEGSFYSDQVSGKSLAERRAERKARIEKRRLNRQKDGGVFGNRNSNRTKTTKP